MDTKYRHEFKHCISETEAIELSKKLTIVMEKDGNSTPNGKYLVTSLYFDNYNDKALREKLDGVNYREKFRIRYYDKDFTFVRLEKKSKLRGLCAKKSCEISKEQCKALLLYGSSVVPAQNPLLTELKTKMTMQLLRPKVIVEYLREAFVCSIGNVRITIDSAIKTSYSTHSFMDKGNKTLTTTSDIILEVKYDEFLPSYISNIIQLGNRKSTAFSKYANARIIY